MKDRIQALANRLNGIDISKTLGKLTTQQESVVTPNRHRNEEHQQIPQLSRTLTLDTQLQPQAKVRTLRQYLTYFDRTALLVRCGACGDHLATCAVPPGSLCDA